MDVNKKKRIKLTIRIRKKFIKIRRIKFIIKKRNLTKLNIEITS
jgi:hypothetical protein